MRQIAEVALPRGLWHDGRLHRHARLRPLTGEDEAWLSDVANALVPAEKVTALLARCLVQLGPAGEVSPESVRPLIVGDREALLLRLRALTLGDHISCSLRCPHEPCGEQLHLDLTAADLLLAPYPDPESSHRCTVGEGDDLCEVRFRLPNGGDVEDVAGLARHDAEAAADALLRRCVESVRRVSDGRIVPEWPPGLTAELSGVIARLDPQAELNFQMSCPACGHHFAALFDTSGFFLREMEQRAQRFHREVHLLAFHYHWGEGEIMGLSAQKRRLYLALLEEELSRGSV